MKHKFKHHQNLNSFYDVFSDDVKLLIEELEQKEIGLALVGGAIRDYVLDGVLPHDLDFEVFPKEKQSEESWINLIKNVFDQRFEKNDFNVHRICIGEYDLEFAPSRFEIYKEKDEAYSHSDFEVVYLTDFEPAKSFLRRDFTCNAMAIKIEDKSAVFVDPFGGVSSLENKELHFCGGNFSKDPVRFLRALRFSQIYNLKITSELKNELKQMNLEKLSEYYLFKEAFKSKDFFLFINSLINLLEEKQKIPEYFEYLKLMDMKLNYFPQDKFELMLGMVLNDIEMETLIELNNLFQFKKGFIAKWKKFFENLNSLEENNFHIKKDFNEFLNDSDKDLYLDLYKQATNLKVSYAKLDIVSSLNRQLFDKIKLIDMLLNAPKNHQTDYKDIKTEDRKYLQAFEFFKAR